MCERSWRPKLGVLITNDMVNIIDVGLYMGFGNVIISTVSMRIASRRHVVRIEVMSLLEILYNYS